MEVSLQAVTLEPHSANFQAQYGWCFMYARRFAEGLPLLQKAVALDDKAGFPIWSLGIAYLETGDYEQAIQTFERGVQITQANHSFYIGLLGGALARAGRAPDARRVLSELRERALREYVPPFDLATILAPLGETDEALAALEKAYEERNALLWFRIYFAMFDPIRSHP